MARNTAGQQAPLNIHFTPEQTFAKLNLFAYFQYLICQQSFSLPVPPEECKSWSRSLIEMHLVRLTNAKAAASGRRAQE